MSPPRHYKPATSCHHRLALISEPQFVVIFSMHVIPLQCTVLLPAGIVLSLM